MAGRVDLSDYSRTYGLRRGGVAIPIPGSANVSGIKYRLRSDDPRYQLNLKARGSGLSRFARGITYREVRLTDLLRLAHGRGVASVMHILFPELTKAEHLRAAQVFYRAYRMQVVKNLRAVDPAKRHISGMGVPRDMLERSNRLMALHQLHFIAAKPRATGYASRGLFKGVFVSFDD